MDYSTENTIIEIVKRPRGRPRKFTAEEQKEKVRIQSQKYYQTNCEKKKEAVKLYYIENRDEFTLNASLIIDKEPLIGIIKAPAKNRLFYAYSKGHSYEIVNDKEINLNNLTNENKSIKAVSYANTLKPEILKIHNDNNISEYQKMKSSYKFCVVATGEFDLYAAEPRACEWDIAAGHAILIHASGSVEDFNGNKILYGKKEFLNPSIVLKSKRLSNG